MIFRIVGETLPHEGRIPGARGHKKITVPKGTAVFCIKYRHLYFWCVYLNKEQAEVCMAGLAANLSPSARRHISLENTLAFNFSSNFPVRVARVKE